MLLEIHAHTSRHSKCSIIDPVALVKEAVRKGLQGILLTDHGYLWSADEIKELRSHAGVEYHFLILSAQEVETDFGHVLVIGADRSLPGRHSLASLRQTYPDAALVWAHPFRNGRIPSKQKLLNPALDALEIFSLNQSAKENYRALSEWHRYKFTAVSGSDAHSSGKVGTYPTHFDHHVKTVGELAEEIKHGRCRPFFKEILKSGSDMTATEVTIGPKGSDELRQRFIVKRFTDPDKWEKAKRSATLTESLSRNGFKDSTFRVPQVVDIDDEEKILIEEGQRGRNLHDVLTSVNPEAGRAYFKLAARWLAKLHTLSLRMDDPATTKTVELGRLTHYENSFKETNNPFCGEISRIAAFVAERETSIIEHEKGSFVQIHGDYHPKNIIIGQDRMHDPSTVFISVIDFNSSLYFSPAFDLGYFLVQFQSQMSGFAALDRYPDDLFIDAYLADIKPVEKYFIEKIAVFKLRAYLNIASYFVKIGMGESAEIARIVSEARSVFDSLQQKQTT